MTKTTLRFALLAAVATLAGPLPADAGSPRHSTLPLAVRENPPWPPRRPTDLGVTPARAIAVNSHSRQILTKAQTSRSTP